MSELKDPLPRALTLLRLIPRAPRKASTTELQERLRDRGFRIDLRSLQRDLRKLSFHFPIDCDREMRPYRWSFRRDALLDLLTPDVPEALALCLAESYLKGILPQGVMYQLSSRFKAARECLEQYAPRNDLARWPQRVRVLPNGKTLIPADIRHEVWADISTALVEQRQIQVAYMSRSKGSLKQLRLHPLSLVSRHSVSYLVANVDGYGDPRQFALHRIQSVSLLEKPVCQEAAFDLDAFISSDTSFFGQSAKRVELVADVHPQIAWLLRETPLSEQQTLDPLQDSDWQLLRAQVPMDQETLWWIFGLNDNIRVHEPEVWVVRIKEKIKALRRMYAID